MRKSTTNEQRKQKATNRLLAKNDMSIDQHNKQPTTFGETKDDRLSTLNKFRILNKVWFNNKHGLVHVLSIKLIARHIKNWVYLCVCVRELKHIETNWCVLKRGDEEWERQRRIHVETLGWDEEKYCSNIFDEHCKNFCIDDSKWDTCRHRHISTMFELLLDLDTYPGRNVRSTGVSKRTPLRYQWNEF